jgi:LmbE family N-acetylglucosaminyl deacetylase
MSRLLLALALSALLTATLPTGALSSSTSSQRDEPEDAELYQALLDLTNPWTVMCVAAHPDDEDGATLTVLRRKTGAHTVTVFSTYGEGGQNATGPELYEELGAIRERETREASAIQGSEPHFLGLRDFGYSKSADETFRVWDHEEALRRMVLQIRRLRPDVIITNHDTSSGHGHHQATGRLVQEAFDTAADPARFPEQLKIAGVDVWQPHRLFVRVRTAGGTVDKDDAERVSALISIDANERDAVRGSTYAEQALRALRRHASQGPWPEAVPAGGRPLIRYRLARSAKQAAPLPSNASSLLEGMTLPEPFWTRLSPAAAKAILPVFLANRRHPEIVFDALMSARHKGMYAVFSADKPRFNLMANRLDRALAVASGVSIKFEPRIEPLMPGMPATFNIVISNRGGAEITAESISFSGGGQATTPLLTKAVRVGPEKNFIATAKYDQSNTLSVNVPRSEHLYDGRVSGEQFRADAVIKLKGVRVTLTEKMSFDVAPAVEIKSITPSPLVLTPPTINKPVPVTISLVNHQRAAFKGKLKSGGLLNATRAEVSFTVGANETLDIKDMLDLQSGGKQATEGTNAHVPDAVTFAIIPGDSSKPLTQQTVRVAYSEARVASRLRVGYVRSFDDTLRDALAALGVESKALTVDDVRAGKLESYSTIILDNRGYQAHPELVSANSRLLEYVRAGGTLVVFYHKTEEWNADPSRGRPQLAPYPITLGNERVTDENAPVTFLDPQHRILNFPNKLTQDDFKGWIQERGLYYPKQWDDRYTALLASNDAGEQPLRGGLLAADYGRGRYIYTSMVWYRQLRAGVPGAYRMLANMLSYGDANSSANVSGKEEEH